MAPPLSIVLVASFLCAVTPRFMQWGWSSSQIYTLFFEVLFAQMVAWGLYFTFVYPFYVSPFRHLPQPKGGNWLIGHGEEMRVQGPGVLARKWVAEVPNEGLIRMLWHFNQEFIFVLSPQALSEVLVTKCYIFEKPPMIRNFLAYALGESVLTVEGDLHRRQRRNLNPAFSFRHVKDLYPVMWNKACESALTMVTGIDEYEDGAGVKELEICSWASRCTLDIIAEAAIGRDFGAIRDNDNALVRSYEGFNPSPSDSFLMGIRGFLPEWVVANLPLRRNRQIAASRKHIREVCFQLIGEKKQKLRNKEHAGLDILSVALQAGIFSDDELADQMLTMLSAGHDTTAAALTWAIYMLCKHPDIQERLRGEVSERLPPVDADAPSITSADIDGLAYLHAVCSEVLRMTPPIAQNMRVATQDTTLQGQVVPRGTVLLLCPWATNTDPKLWGADAGEFKPERWLWDRSEQNQADHHEQKSGKQQHQQQGSGGATSNYSFLTFLHGPRSCIGASFARAELACLLAAWVSRFEFRLRDEELLDERNVRVEPSVTTKPVGGLHVLVRVVG